MSVLPKSLTPFAVSTVPSKEDDDYIKSVE